MGKRGHQSMWSSGVNTEIRAWGQTWFFEHVYPSRVAAIEAKINPDAFDAASLLAFRQLYPTGRNLLFCPFVTTPYTVTKKGLLIEVRATAQA